MPFSVFEVLVTAIIALLVIWLVYRMRNIRTIIKDEIFSNFPSIKDSMSDFENRLEFLNTKLESLENRLKQFEERLKGVK